MMYTRLLKKHEQLPYNLLLLADEEMQAIERYIHQSAVYVVEQDDLAIGVYALYPVDERVAEIKAIAVAEEFQNRGIGRFLLRDAEEKAREQGYTELIIGTPDIAVKQLAIYEKAGFERYEIKKNFFIDYYTAPIFEDGVQLSDMAMLRKLL
ncbi:GNAT family N-acetyltransferase [Mucilaginibacter mali]|uniref:GNAT family N-acetyltransferase n=1 Tax=Mucilaginibacter mali TaxID=2740462 RepID=A0A7D4TP62_9SPHI|nr:GNAT family N-acetyltransferase [Mucilaginibacter mali]QKJ30494.1 GNAT family N-acetyltransferase [Mucilaginibacter mali]